MDPDLSLLLERGVIDLSDLVDGDVRLVSVTRRNFNLRLERRRGSSYLIKRPDPLARSQATLAAEIRFYTLCDEEPRLAEVRRHMASLQTAFPEDGMLVIELLEGARPLREELSATSLEGMSATPAERLGTALGTLHKTFRDPELLADPRLDLLTTAPPWSLSLHRPRLAQLRRLSAALSKLLRIVQTTGDLFDHLDHARHAWTPSTVLHGDIRSSNVLVVHGPPSDVRLVDWELVQKGDPAWDVGGTLEDFILFWLRGIELAPELKAEERVGTAAHPLETVRTIVTAFWDAYRRAAELDPATAERLLQRAILFSAFRLLQSAWEHSSEAERLSSLVVLMVQVAANILADPAAARSGLYGLEPRTS